MLDDDHQIYSQLTNLGDFYPLRFKLDVWTIKEFLRTQTREWVFYNSAKPNFRRWGISLTSLNGSTSGEIDLNSLKDYNEANGTSLNEMSFRTITKYWNLIPSLKERLHPLQPYLGRSHIIRLEPGGYFPPHRDLGDSFRLISIIEGTSQFLRLMIDDRMVHFEPGRVYFLNTQREHCLFNLSSEDGIILVLNCELSQESIRFVKMNLYVQ